MEFVCSSEGAENWPAEGRQNPTFRHFVELVEFYKYNMRLVPKKGA